ncbi:MULTISPECIES: phosphoglucomutase (alpha-D-glucose-1,6-bisphosphate-dependent) [unclassified Schlesneria]|uniref:phosphoglucomutase (alpha-D-glucose-1,6-bisphosphate-dependent) n=1 Tax=unclassified Schlesneria TaxID=2762017 RepID=UPI002F132D02
MATSPLAGLPAPHELLIDTSRLIALYYDQRPDPENKAQLVSFGTSGHRGTSKNGTFTESHIVAITQALIEYRSNHGITGPLFLGKDTHALSGPAEQSALEVLAANGIETCIQNGNGFTPTPTVSHAILCYNRDHSSGPQADGIVITPSHNPPEDGGFKYNPPNGGPADTDITGWVQNRANELLKAGISTIRRVSYEAALNAPTTTSKDFARDYIDDLKHVIDMDVIRRAGLRIGVDPLGGAAVGYWQTIAETYGLDVTVVNPRVDPAFGFMTVDHDGKIRMDCSSPYAMASLVKLKDQFDIAFGNDPDTDRHGIVTKSSGLMNPNHYLAVAIRYLFQHRAEWPATAGVGKTCVSSQMIDCVASSIGRNLYEVPVGFKWFVDGLYSGTLGFGGEESAGASFLRMDGSAWSTDKDGIILALLAAEITAKTGRDPGEHYRDLVAEFGERHYTRIDQPISLEEKEAFKRLKPASVTSDTLAGEAITAKLDVAPGNQKPIGGIKVTTDGGWFAARPSGTEAIYKLYAESCRDEQHLQQIVSEAREIVSKALSAD